MKFEDVLIVAKPLVLATQADVDALTSRLWITFPAGYREYVSRLGEGALGGSFIRIYPPWRIERELTEWRRRLNKYWFWDSARMLLPKERALECVILGDTVNGDELVFHPSRPDRIFVLPRDSDQVLEAGAELLAAIDWICTSGELIEPFADRSFEPFDSRGEAPKAGEGTTPADPEGESLDEIVDFGKRWSERHSAKKQAKADLKSQCGTGGKTELLYESIIIDGRFPYEPGYAVAWRIVDKAGGLEVGVFRWNKSRDSHGSAFEPKDAKGPTGH